MLGAVVAGVEVEGTEVVEEGEEDGGGGPGAGRREECGG